MNIVDKRGKLASINRNNNSVLELGCGNLKRLPDSIGIDSLDYDCVDIVGDVYDILSKIPDNSIQAIYSCHFVEHVVDFSTLIGEIARVLTVGGKLEIVAPHFSNPYYYSDHTHKNYFGLYTFSYFSKDLVLRRKVPNYQREPEFILEKVSLVFKSSPPFYIRHALKFIIGSFFNLNTYMKEFYEEFFCYIFPCYEIKYALTKIDKNAHNR